MSSFRRPSARPIHRRQAERPGFTLVLALAIVVVLIGFVSAVTIRMMASQHSAYHMEQTIVGDDATSAALNLAREEITLHVDELLNSGWNSLPQPPSTALNAYPATPYSDASASLGDDAATPGAAKQLVLLANMRNWGSLDDPSWWCLPPRSAGTFGVDGRDSDYPPGNISAGVNPMYTGTWGKVDGTQWYCNYSDWYNRILSLPPLPTGATVSQVPNTATSRWTNWREYRATNTATASLWDTPIYKKVYTIRGTGGPRRVAVYARLDLRNYWNPATAYQGANSMIWHLAAISETTAQSKGRLAQTFVTVLVGGAQANAGVFTNPPTSAWSVAAGNTPWTRYLDNLPARTPFTFGRIQTWNDPAPVLWDHESGLNYFDPLAGSQQTPDGTTDDYGTGYADPHLFPGALDRIFAGATVSGRVFPASGDLQVTGSPARLPYFADPSHVGFTNRPQRVYLYEIPVDTTGKPLPSDLWNYVAAVDTGVGSLTWRRYQLGALNPDYGNGWSTPTSPGTYYTQVGLTQPYPWTLRNTTTTVLPNGDQLLFPDNTGVPATNRTNYDAWAKFMSHTYSALADPTTGAFEIGPQGAPRTALGVNGMAPRPLPAASGSGSIADWTGPVTALFIPGISGSTLTVGTPAQIVANPTPVLYAACTTPFHVSRDPQFPTFGFNYVDAGGFYSLDPLGTGGPGNASNLPYAMYVHRLSDNTDYPIWGLPSGTPAATGGVATYRYHVFEMLPERWGPFIRPQSATTSLGAAGATSSIVR